jgi:hypothetical protein
VRANDFQVTEFLSRDVEQHVAPARIVFAYRLCEISARRGQFTLRTAKLFKQEIGKAGIRRRYTDGIASVQKVMWIPLEASPPAQWGIPQTAICSLETELWAMTTHMRYVPNPDLRAIARA